MCTPTTKIKHILSKSQMLKTFWEMCQLKQVVCRVPRRVVSPQGEVTKEAVKSSSGSVWKILRTAKKEAVENSSVSVLKIFRTARKKGQTIRLAQCLVLPLSPYTSCVSVWRDSFSFDHLRTTWEKDLGLVLRLTLSLIPISIPNISSWCVLPGHL